MANWELKSACLLREIAKFQTYVESLEAAIGQKERDEGLTERVAGLEAEREDERGSLLISIKRS